MLKVARVYKIVLFFVNWLLCPDTALLSNIFSSFYHFLPRSISYTHCYKKIGKNSMSICWWGGLKVTYRWHFNKQIGKNGKFNEYLLMEGSKSHITLTFPWKKIGKNCFNAYSICWLGVWKSYIIKMSTISVFHATQ